MQLAPKNKRKKKNVISSTIPSDSSAFLPLWDLVLSGLVTELHTPKTFLIGGISSMTSVSKRCGGNGFRSLMS